jgi:CO/xanthine dehydrogenase Mo-binding subunit
VPLIGVPTPRRDSEAKVLGTTRFAADTQIPGLLHARLVLAHEAHAMIASIGTEEALRQPGVVAVLTAADLPIASSGKGRLFEPLAREEVVYAGQPVAIVVAESAAAAADGAQLVEVDLDPLEAVLDLEAAILSDAPLARVTQAEESDEGGLSDAHASVDAGGVDDEDLSANVLGTARLADGDVEAALAASAAVVRGRFRTPWVYQGYLEPQNATAWMDPEGELTIRTSTQAPFSTRDSISRLYGLAIERVRVRWAPIGGGFGGKMLIIEPLAVGAALATGRPVRLELTRTEDMSATNPVGAEIIDLELGADADGRLTGVRSRALLDRGASEDMGMEAIAAILASGPYNWQAHELTAIGVMTNRVTLGAYRAPCAPPAAFAVESLLDDLARELGIDALELRLRNVAVEGDPTAAGQPFPVFGARECLERAGESALWARRDELPDDEGIGIAIGWWPGGYEPASAACRLDSDGKLTVITGTADISGVETTFAAIAADAFGLSADEVRITHADTSSAPYAGTAGGSKVTYTVGRAVERAAIEARDRLFEVAAEELEISPEDLEVAEGTVRPRGVPAKAIPLAQIASKVLSFGSRHMPIEGQGRSAQPQAPQSAAHVSHVRVDAETGAVTLLGHYLAQDVGRALNPALVEGQMRGGATQGFGWALLEELAHDEYGQLITGSLVDYAMPSAEIAPWIETEIVEVPAPEGPYGAKGVGEAPIVGVAGAVANAIAAATDGVRVTQLPMTAERVWRAIADRQAAAAAD